MNPLANLSYSEDIKQEKDTLGGRQLLESDVYLATIKAAYFGESSGGAISLTVVAETSKGEYRETLYLTNKEKKNFYVNSRGEKNYLPGFLHADAICLLAAQKPLGEMATEKKVFKVYNTTAKTDVPTEVDALPELEGKEIKLGILKEKSFKSVKQADGTYADSDETRESNVIDKVFKAKDDKTVQECRSQAPNAVFMGEWLNKWKGQTKDQTSKSKGTAAGASRTPAVARPTTSLFN